MMRKAAQNITRISQTVENKAASVKERMSYTVFRTGYILDYDFTLLTKKMFI